MRNRRLLTLAVLAVAIGFAAQAEAWTPPDPYYGTAVVTLIKQNAIEGVGTFDINISLWDDTGIGVPADGTAGLIDFNIQSIAGTGGDVVTGINVTAPIGEVSNVGDTLSYLAGFTQELMSNAGSVFNVSCVQPVMYSNGDPNTLRDAAIVIGVGTTGLDGGTATQNEVGYFSHDPGPFAGDTPIITGGYTGGDGVLGAITFGAISFSVLPNEAGTTFVGPMADNGNSTTVKAVVVQTITGPSAAGNGGGAWVLEDGNSALAKVTIKVEVGDIILGDLYAGGKNVTLQVSDANTSVTMAADHIFGGEDNGSLGTKGGLDIRKDNDGNQVVDVSTALIAVYTPDPAQTLINIKGDEYNPTMLGDANDGLYSSAIDPENPAHVLVVTLGPAADCVLIKATIMGDVDLSGTVDGTDYTLMGDNWLQSGGWSQGDLDGSGTVDGTDYTLMGDNWLQTFVPFVPEPAGAVPEPATMSLLCLGALGLLRRRRGN